MTQYLILIYGDEQRWEAMAPSELSELHAAHGAFRSAAGDAIRASGQLDASRLASTVRASGVTDGPFLETKEVLGGFYLVDVATKDEAVRLAGLLYEARQDHSAVEVAPLVG